MSELMRIQEVKEIPNGELPVHAIRMVLGEKTEDEIVDGGMKLDGIQKVNMMMQRKFLRDAKWIDESEVKDALYSKCFEIAKPIELKKKADSTNGGPLLAQIIKNANQIATTTRRGAGNVLVYNKAAKAIFDSLEYEVDNKGTIVKGLFNSLYVAHSYELCVDVLNGSIIMEEYDDKSEEPHILLAFVGTGKNDTGVIVAKHDDKYTIVDDLEGTENYYILIKLLKA